MVFFVHELSHILKSACCTVNRLQDRLHTAQDDFRGLMHPISLDPNLYSRYVSLGTRVTCNKTNSNCVCICIFVSP